MNPFLSLVKRTKLRLEGIVYSRRKIFSRVYSKQAWGSMTGEPFCSGGGSTEGYIVDPYVECIAQLAMVEGFLNKRFVDLGCGDFRVGQRLRALSSMYHGVDIVPELIRFNRMQHADNKCVFSCLDLVEDPLPDGDVCLIRQVFQHLSNREILSILPKLSRYKWVFISEHNPSDDTTVIPNIDKVHGGSIRLESNSGVYLEQPPFSLPKELIKCVLQVPIKFAGEDWGTFYTYLYRPCGPNEQKHCV
jgi:SAM-dependent methyltransferase